MMEAATLDRPKASELEREAGPATGEMPPNDDLNTPAADVEIEIDGTTQLALFKLGGKQPTRATLKLTGGAVALVEGEAFNKGDRIRFTGEAVVNYLGQKDEHDSKTGQVVSCEQQHKARLIDLQIESAG